jgi:hypothetical protein
MQPVSMIFQPKALMACQAQRRWKSWISMPSRVSTPSLSQSLTYSWPLGEKRCLPRYLFRAYGPDSGGALEQKKYEDLNTENSITPHAFMEINGVNRGHEHASKIPNPERMINGHIHTTKDIQSEFSSWTPSLLLVLCYAEQKFVQHESAHVCVIDTYKIRNGVFHVPTLINVGLARKGRRRVILSGDPFREEYLVHGVVSGKGYHALSYGKIRRDLLKVYPEIRNNMDWGYALRRSKFDPSFATVKITSVHIELLKGIAESFGPREIVFPLTISLVCLVKRFNLDYTAAELCGSPEFKTYVQALKSITTHIDVDENWLVHNHQWIGRMTEVKHTKMMMQALIWSKFGRGKRSGVDALAAQLESTQIHGGK